MKISPRAQWIQEGIKSWTNNNPMRLSAALAYYSVFSIAPLLLITLAIVNAFWNSSSSKQVVFDRLRDVFGADGVHGIELLMQNLSSGGSRGWIASVIGVVTLFIGATTIFGELQDSLNLVWKVEPDTQLGWKKVIRQRGTSFLMVVVLGLFFLLTILLGEGMKLISHTGILELPGGNAIWGGVSFVFGVATTAILFGAIYKILPDVKLTWYDVGVGAGISALLFTLGQSIISFYLAKFKIASSYGVAGAALAFMVWAYYSSAVFLLGAELTRSFVLRLREVQVPAKKRALRA